MSTLIDLTGQKFGEWTVLGIGEKDKHGNVCWICKCSCDSIHTVRGAELRSNRSRGCHLCMATNTNIKHSKYAVIINKIYNNYKASAKRRKINFDLVVSEFARMISLPCYYCGASKSNLRSVKFSNIKVSMRYNGIDRVDNTKGYTSGNIVSCCITCNQAKSAKTIHEWNQWIIRLVNHNIDKNTLGR